MNLNTHYLHEELDATGLKTTTNFQSLLLKMAADHRCPVFPIPHWLHNPHRNPTAWFDSSALETWMMNAILFFHFQNTTLFSIFDWSNSSNRTDCDIFYVPTIHTDILKRCAFTEWTVYVGMMSTRGFRATRRHGVDGCVVEMCTVLKGLTNVP